jgi:hypothetical protein
MQVRVEGHPGGPGWGEVLVDPRPGQPPLLYYAGALWSAAAALHRGLRFPDAARAPTDPAGSADRRWALALVAAAIRDQTSWRRLMRLPLARLVQRRAPREHRAEE